MWPRRRSNAVGAAASISTSVVVPTRDRPGDLARCLTALARQGEDLEVVVVDDGSADRAAVASVAQDASVLLRRGGDGPAAARNAGIAAASGDVVLFVDDDCEPEPNWAAALRAAALGGSGVASGRTRAPDAADAAVRASQAVIDALQLDRGKRAGDELAFAPTCNLACSRAVLEEVRFDESFPLAAGEDRVFSDRLVAAGHPPVYEPAAVVVHHQDPGVRALLKRQYRYGQGAAQYLARDDARGQTPPGFRRRLLRRCLREGAGVAALAVAGQAATVAGYLRG